jgi:6,7-dimethyl-8-ribityllumazine synthase
MATENNNLSFFNKEEIPNANGIRFGIVVSEWNKEITDKLLEGAKETLLDCGALESGISIMEVPGSFELIFGAKIIAKKEVNAVIYLSGPS